MLWGRGEGSGEAKLLLLPSCTQWSYKIGSLVGRLILDKNTKEPVIERIVEGNDMGKSGCA